jgi:hypothetical protein
MTTLDTVTLPNVREGTDGLEEIDVTAGVLWGAQTQRSLEHFSIRHDLIPREITYHTTPNKAATYVKDAAGRLSDRAHERSREMCCRAATEVGVPPSLPLLPLGAPPADMIRKDAETISKAASSADCSRTLASAISRSALYRRPEAGSIILVIRCMSRTYGIGHVRWVPLPIRFTHRRLSEL